MRIRRNFGLSRKALLRHRVRTGLAVVGTSVGVAAVLVMVAIGEGAERELVAQVEALGGNLLVVGAERSEPLVGRSSSGALFDTLRPEDADAVLDAIPEVSLVAPSYDNGRQVKVGALSQTATIRATTPEYELIRNFHPTRGRYFTAEENEAAVRVAVLGARIARDLFAGVDPVGETVRIGGVPFEVVGVLESKGATTNQASDEDAQVLVPLKTGMRRVFNVDYVTLLYVQARDGADLDAVATRIGDVLRERHGLERLGRPDDFRVDNQMVVLQARRAAAASFERLIMTLASVALLVGGIGILSIMMLSIRERRNEIGLRIAVGAKRRDVRAQFVLEALLLGMAGGLAGLLMGVAAAASVGRATEWRTEVSPPAIAIAVGAALAVSLVFGVYPAQRAAALDPIESLRAE